MLVVLSSVKLICFEYLGVIIKRNNMALSHKQGQTHFTASSCYRILGSPPTAGPRVTTYGLMIKPVVLIGAELLI